MHVTNAVKFLLAHRQGFFHQEVLSCPDGFNNLLRMKVMPGPDDHHLDVWVAEDLPVIGGDVTCIPFVARGERLAWRAVGNGGNFVK